MDKQTNKGVNILRDTFFHYQMMWVRSFIKKNINEVALENTCTNQINIINSNKRVPTIQCNQITWKREAVACANNWVIFLTSYATCSASSVIHDKENNNQITLLVKLILTWIS